MYFSVTELQCMMQYHNNLQPCRGFNKLRFQQQPTCTLYVMGEKENYTEVKMGNFLQWNPCTQKFATVQMQYASMHW